MGTETEDNQEYIFICEMVLQNPPKGTITTFQRLVDGEGNVTSTQTATIAATSTKNWNLIPENGSYTLTGEAISLGGQYAMTAANGALTLAGTDVNFNYYTMAADSGTFNVTGTAIDLTRYVMTADNGAYTINGTDVDWIYP